MPTRRTAARPSDAAQHEYETTFRTLRPVVARFASARINTDEVDDVVAQTFLTAWRRRADAPVDRDLYRAWLLRITRNEILNHRRSRRRRGALEERMSRQPSDTTTIHLDRPRLRDEVLDHQLVALLDRLEARDRQLLALVAWRGLNLRDVAELLGCSHDAARARLHRLRRRSQVFLTELGEA